VPVVVHAFKGKRAATKKVEVGRLGFLCCAPPIMATTSRPLKVQALRTNDAEGISGRCAEKTRLPTPLPHLHIVWTCFQPRSARPSAPSIGFEVNAAHHRLLERHAHWFPQRHSVPPHVRHVHFRELSAPVPRPRRARPKTAFRFPGGGRLTLYCQSARASVRPEVQIDSVIACFSTAT
jgi:hypothetical protein